MIRAAAMIRLATLAIAAGAVVLTAGVSRAEPQQHQDSLGADWRDQQDEARRAVREGRYLPLDRVIEAIRRSSPGRQLDSGIENEPNGRAVYRVRWAAADGRRIDYIVDVVTGRILRAEGR